MEKIKKNNYLKILIIFLIIILFFGFRFYIDNYTFETNSYNLKISSESNEKYSNLINKKIVFISDLHNQSYGDNNSLLIDAIVNEKPDYIVMVGDMVSAEDTEFKGFYDLVNGISQFNTFYVAGNHEHGLSKNDLNNIYDFLKSKNVYVLDNSSVKVDGINFYGLNYPVRYYLMQKYSLEKMNNDLETANKNELNILLAHNPDDFEIYKDWGADIVFAGHTHGGMVRLFDIGLISTDRKFFPYFDGGVFSLGNSSFDDGVIENDYTILNNSKMVVSRGLSRGHVGFRLFNVPEVVVIDFKE